jgi:hypothetical protein
MKKWLGIFLFCFLSGYCLPCVAFADLSNFVIGGHANNWNRFFAFPQQSEQVPPGISCKTSTGLPDDCVWIGGDGGFSTKLPPDPETGEVRTIYLYGDGQQNVLDVNAGTHVISTEGRNLKQRFLVAFGSSK